MNFATWWQNNKYQFDSSYEELFVVNVLSQVADLDFSTVRAQYPFKDLDGKQRYCDFVIEEGSIRIAIEVDGYDKTNSGRGMTHGQFVDWQRRQSSLTTAGWYVLRFANRDVRDQPSRCRRYIELLLQDQRSKSQHQQRLAEELQQMNSRLAQAVQSQSTEKVEQLQAQVAQLKQHLAAAQNAQPLSADDKKDKEQFEALLNENVQLKKEKQVLNQENQTMRTTIWAFTAIIALVIAAGAYVLVHNNSTGPAPIQGTNTGNNSTSDTTDLAASQQAKGLPSCSSAIPWSEAKALNNQRVTVEGVVAEYRYMPRVKGQPTWINLGAKYPDKNRFTIVVWGDKRDAFGSQLSAALTGQTVCATGIVKIREGVPQLVLYSPQNLLLP